MSIFPSSFSEVLDRLRNDFQNSNETSNPFLRVGFLKSLLDSHAGRYFDIYRKAEEVLKQAFIATSSGVGLLQHGIENDISLSEATESSGQGIATGVLNELISSGSELVASTGDIFVTSADATITNESITITSITQTDGVATATAVDHQMASGFDVTISGANETDYNGTFTVIAIDEDTFTYVVPSATASPATGTILASSLRAILFLDAQEGGQNGNLSANEKIDFVITSPNVNSEAAIIFNGMTGGADEQTEDELQVEILDFVREPVAPFNVSNIKFTIKNEVPTASRIFVNEITPGIGQVTTYFVEDSQTNILPSAATLQKAKDALETIRTADVDTADVFVLAPTLVSTDFTFTSISPSNQAMRDAIQANLEFFFDSTVEGVDITEEEYTNVLLNTVETTTGAILESYVLSTPSGDITIASGELGTLGNVTF